MILWTVARQAPLSMGILQARILKWVAVPSSRGLFSSYGARASHCRGFSCRAWTLGHVGFGSCGAPAYLLSGMWNLPRPGIEPVFDWQVDF